jgi:membrane fusion protein, multidrug efflux system
MAEVKRTGQLQNPPWRRAAWIAFGLMMIAGVILGVREMTGTAPSTGGGATHAAQNAIPVTAATATVQDFAEIIDTFGNVQSIDAVSVLPRATGTIEKVEFTPGQDVKQGQELFLIDPRPYEAALNETKGQLARDQGSLEEAEVDLKRFQKLLAQDSIADQTEKDQLYVVQQDQGTVQLDQADVEAAQLNLLYAHVTAPISGRTGMLQVDLGNLVGASSQQAASSASTSSTSTNLNTSTEMGSLVSITQLQPIYVTFTIPQTFANEVIQNQANGPLEVDAYSQTGKLLDKGKVTLIDNQVSTATGTLTLQATFANSDNLLWPGEYVSVQLKYGTLRNAITVPSSAIMVGPNGDYIYTIASGNKVKQVNVDETTRRDGVSVIGKGISAGQTVVVTGQYRLTDGSLVAIQQPPSSTSEGKAQTAEGSSSK